MDYSIICIDIFIKKYKIIWCKRKKIWAQDGDGLDHGMSSDEDTKEHDTKSCLLSWVEQEKILSHRFQMNLQKNKTSLRSFYPTDDTQTWGIQPTGSVLVAWILCNLELPNLRSHLSLLCDVICLSPFSWPCGEQFISGKTKPSWRELHVLGPVYPWPSLPQASPQVHSAITTPTESIPHCSSDAVNMTSYRNHLLKLLSSERGASMANTLCFINFSLDARSVCPLRRHSVG